MTSKSDRYVYAFLIFLSFNYFVMALFFYLDVGNPRLLFVHFPEGVRHIVHLSFKGWIALASCITYIAIPCLGYVIFRSENRSKVLQAILVIMAGINNELMATFISEFIRS